MIPLYYNIPIVSWLLLRGRCAFCGTSIPIRYPILELVMGVVFASLFHRYGWSFLTLEYLLFAFAAITASFIDLDHMILPDRLTLSGILIGLVGAWFNPDRLFLQSFLGFLLGGGFLYAVAWFYFTIRKVDGMGGGDIKLLGWIGAVCGIQSLLFVVLCSSLLGLVVRVLYMFKSKQGLKTGIPFGPFLTAAALLFLLFDTQSLMLFLFPYME